MTEFGYFLSGEELDPATLVAAGQAAERAGFERLWVSDHFHPWLLSQDESPFIWSVLGALAATTKCHLTTAVTCPIIRIHPAILAQATATTAYLAPGRFSFGIGTGERLNEHIFGDPWLSVESRLQQLEEAVEVIRALWTGETLTHHGDYYQVETATIHSLPDELPPILVSAFGPVAVAHAAKIGDGFITVGPEAELRQSYYDQGGTGISQVGAKICWAASEEEAAETAHRLWGHEAIGGPPAQELGVPEHFQALADATSPQDMKEGVHCGPDADKCAEFLRAHVDAGFDEVYISQIGPQQEEGIRFLVDEVLPKL